MTTSTEVPHRFPVGINGRTYLVDDRNNAGIKRRSVPFLKAQQDNSPQTGGASLSPDAAWRRSVEDWSAGAGQTRWDREASNPARFRSSKGVDPWTKWQVTLLPATTSVRTIAGTGVAEGSVVTATDRLYVVDNNEVYYSSDLSTWTAVGIAAGEGAVTIADIASDQFTVVVALGANGTHTYETANGSFHRYDLNADSVEIVKGRLMAGKDGKLYNLTAGGAAPPPLYTHAHDVTGWKWTAFAEGPNHLYAAGHNAFGLSEIFKITIQPDGIALTAPTLAAPRMPVGEKVLSMLGYAGFVIVGTSQGLRLASVGSDGNLSLGTLVEVPNCTALAPKGRFVYFAWNSYETGLHGLGRADLSTFTAALTPAYASDLMGGDGAAVRGIAILGERVVFGIGGRSGVSGAIWAESLTQKVASGTIESGVMSYGIPDQKVSAEMDVRHLPLVGSHAGALSTDAGAYVALGTHSTQGEVASTPFSTLEARGENFEMRHTLTRQSSTDTVGPTITRSTLSAFPVPKRTGEHIIIPLLLFDDIEVIGAGVSMSPKTEFDALLALETAGTVVDVQLAGQTLRALLNDHSFETEGRTKDGTWWNGVYTLDAKIVSS